MSLVCYFSPFSLAEDLLILLTFSKEQVLDPLTFFPSVVFLSHSFLLFFSFLLFALGLICPYFSSFQSDRSHTVYTAEVPGEESSSSGTGTCRDEGERGREAGLARAQASAGRCGHGQRAEPDAGA